MEIVVYSSPSCSYCHALKQFLAERRINYRDRDVTTDRTAAQELMSRTGQMGVPVTIIDGQTIVGFDRPRLEQALSRWQQTQRPSFGASVADAAKMAAKQGSPTTLGAYVGSVKPGSAAERAGLAPGDIITEVNTQRIANASDLQNVMSRMNKGVRFTLSVLRAGRTISTETTL